MEINASTCQNVTMEINASTCQDVTMEINASTCQNVTIDLSESSLRLMSNRHLLVFIVTISCVISAFTVGANILIIAGVLHFWSGSNKTFISSDISSNTKLLMASFAFSHLIVGGVCMPTAILQMVSNGAWSYGPDLCAARTYVESLMEIVGVYHVISMSIDTYIAVCQPLKYRMLTSGYAYAMLCLSWLPPVAIFVAPVFLGGYRNGKEDIFECLSLYHSCVTIYGRDALLLILPLVTAFPFCVVLIIYILILSKISRFHSNRLKRNNHNSKTNHKTVTNSRDDQKVLSRISDDTFNETGENINVFTISDSKQVRKRLSETTIEIESVKSTGNNCAHPNINYVNDLSEADDLDIVKSSNSQQKNKSINKRSKIFALRVHSGKISQTDRKWKAFPFMIVMATWFCIYWLSIMVFYFYFAYNTTKTPVRLILAVGWFFYLNSLISPIQLLRNKSLRHSVLKVLRMPRNNRNVFI